MMEEFKSFAIKGNVMDLAVAVIIGAAFGKIVDSLVQDLIMPVVGKIFGGLDFSNYYLPLNNQGTQLTLVEAKKAGAVFAYGNFLTILINFIILAFIIFQMVRIANKAHKLKVVEVAAPPSMSADRPEPPAPAEPPADTRATVKQLRSEVATALERYGIEVEAFKRFATETWRTEDWGRSPEALGKAAALLKEVGPQLVRLRMLLQGMNVPTDRYAIYATRRFRREHWQLQPDTVARAIREAEEHAQAPEALSALIETELDAG